MSLFEFGVLCITFIVFIVVTVVIFLASLLVLKSVVGPFPSLVLAGVVPWLTKDGHFLTREAFIASTNIFATIGHLGRRSRDHGLTCGGAARHSRSDSEWPGKDPDRASRTGNLSSPAPHRGPQPPSNRRSMWAWRCDGRDWSATDLISPRERPRGEVV